MTISSSSEQQSHLEDVPAGMAALVSDIVRPLVDRPESLVVETETTEAGTMLRLFVDADDLGKVIGKQGRTARSLRTILSAIGSKTGHRYTLDVLELQ